MDFGDLRKKNKGEYISIPPTKEIPEEGFRWMSNEEWDASVQQKTYFFFIKTNIIKRYLCWFNKFLFIRNNMIFRSKLIYIRCIILGLRPRRDSY